MSTTPLVVELLCEELPPRALATLGDSFAGLLAKELIRRRFVTGPRDVKSFATPRRLAVLISDVLDVSPSEPFTERLMPVSIGLDSEGNPTPALKKKLAARQLSHVPVSELRRESDGKTQQLVYSGVAAGQALQVGLLSALEEAIEKLPIPKVMSYQLADGTTTVRFVRPAHGLVALHGSEVVPVSVLGLDAGRTIRGHRFQGADKFDLARAEDYESALGGMGGVIASFAARKAEILRQLEAEAKARGVTLGPADGYTALLDEVTALVEMPTVYAGTYDPEFLAVPAECLVLTMRQNQKYFPLFDAGGRLTHHFLMVSNMRLDDPSNIVRGNERVVRPRLADAQFFFETDKKTRLAARVPQLALIVYHNKLGTQLDRVDRLVSLSMKVQESLPRGKAGVEWAVQAARLAKADLTTLMVGEFPELQGVMGRYYAESDGEEPSVCRAIEQHYWPRFAGDALPTGDASIAVALADRLDTLVAMFSIGQVPTGDKDPFGLRRAALGVVRILMETSPALNADLAKLIASAAEVLKVPEDRRSAVVGSVRGFVRERLANLMKERGYSANEVAAVLEVESAESRPDRLDLIPRKLEAVREFRKLPEAESLAAANKRIANILRQAYEKGERMGFPDGHSFGEKLESDLHSALKRASAVASPLFEKGDYTGYLKSFAVLKQPVDAFFDGIMVMAEDPVVRRRRLSLLYALEFEMNRVADIARLAA
jgi:glycyl-tRNA synthetase beta chain